MKSNKGGQKICCGGFMYTRHKETANGIRWRCTKRAQGCKGAVITTSGDDDLNITSEHNHGPSDIETNITKTRLTMKQVALMSSEKPASVVAQALQGLGEEEKMAIKSEDSF